MSNITGDSGDNILNGGAAADVIDGLGGNDTLYGKGGDDTLIGGDGIDMIYGGAGDDTFRVGSGEAAAGEVYSGGIGNDLILISSLSPPLAGDGVAADFRSSAVTSIEGVSFEGSLLQTADFNAAMVGGGLSAALHVEGSTGTDQLRLTMANSTVLDLGGWTFGNWNGTVVVNGDASAETVTGTSANDYFNLGKGLDIAHGGAGDDGFDVSNAQAGEVFDGGAGGNDWLSVHATNADLRGASVVDIERIVFAQSDGQSFGATVDAAQFGSGGLSDALVVESRNANPNVLTIDMDTLSQFSAAQITVVPGINPNVANTIVIQGDGDAETITGSAFSDIIHGGGGADMLLGGGGDDFLDGGSGADTMIGGAGNDDYFVDDLEDHVLEVVNGVDQGGFDLVRSLVNYTLGAKLDDLQLQGSANINGFGNGLDNALAGNDGNNILKGGGGADIITGRGGADRLSGGAGIDLFNYIAITESGVGAGKRDVITDFQIGKDIISVAQIDADPGTPGDDAFVEHAGGTFAAGEFTITTVNGNTLVSFYTDAGATPDMQIVLLNVTGVTSADFEL